MVTTPNDLYKRAMGLNEQDRAELVARLLDSLDLRSEDGVESAWLNEIERRVEKIDSDTVRTVSWADVRSRVFEPRDP